MRSLILFQNIHCGHPKSMFCVKIRKVSKISTEYFILKALYTFKFDFCNIKFLYEKNVVIA